MKKKEYLLVDGYNVIHGWDKLREIALISLEDARVELIHILSNYKGYQQVEVIVVFDAHKQKGNVGTYELHHNIHVVYTKESQTADSYIERFAAVNAAYCRIRVVTNDTLEQIIILGRGAYRISVGDLIDEIYRTKKQIKEHYLDNKPVKNNMLMDRVDDQTAKLLEQMRFGGKGEKND